MCSLADFVSMQYGIWLSKRMYTINLEEYSIIEKVAYKIASSSEMIEAFSRCQYDGVNEAS